MSLQRVIELIDRLEKELVLFNVEPTDPIDDRLSEHFGTHNVTITTAQTASGRPTDVAVLSTEGEVLEVLDVGTLREFVEYSPARSRPVGIAGAKFERILSHLKETTFATCDTEEMLYASREIEDRARRVGTGTIHAGFQQCSLMADQQGVYTDLAQRGLAVHTYGVPDISPPDLGDAQVHTSHANEIAAMWVVVFDGSGDGAQKTAIIAEEVDGGLFRGGWTYDPRIVDHVIDCLEDAYLSDNSTAQPAV